MAPSKKQTSKTNEAVELLIKQRNNSRANISRISDLVFNSKAELSVEELDCRLEIVETYFAQALEHQTSIEEFDFEPENINATDVRGDLENLYCQVKVKIRSLMKREGEVGCAKSSAKRSQLRSTENLPKLKLPTFSGKYSEFPNFYRLFKTLVHDDSQLTKIEKFNHLHSCLSGAALRTIKALDLVDENYDTALKLLESRFNNKYLMCQEHIRDLVHIDKIQKGSADQLRLLIDSVNAHFNALSSLLSHEEIVHALIVHFVLAAVDVESQVKIEESIDCSTSVSWNSCSKVLTQRCQVLEAREPSGSNRQQVRSNKPQNKNANAVAFPVVEVSCKICKQQTDHLFWKCPRFLELTPMQRFDAVKRLSLCINCFSPKHSVKQCKSTRCKLCNESHNTLLHRGMTVEDRFESNAHQQQQPQHISSSQIANADNNSRSPASLVVSQYQENSSQMYEVKSNTSEQTILATAIVKITDKCGNEHYARALLDSASQINFITNDLAHKLGLKRLKSYITIGGIGEFNTTSKYSTTAHIKSCTSNFNETLQFLILPTITGTQPNGKINIESWSIPESYKLADPCFNVPHKIELLIGAHMFFEILLGNQIQINKNGPMLFETRLGWVVAGKCNNSSDVRHAFVVNSQPNEIDDNLENIVKQFWDLEKVPQSKHKLSKEQEECEQYFQQTTTRLPCGRFVVRLPLKQDASTLGSSKHTAIRRFQNLENKLALNNNLKNAYCEFLQQYESDGHMQQIQWPNDLTGYYFLPHHCVLRPEKSTTKCRVVFDASAKTTNNISLNDILKVGPVVQNELFDVLLRFRLHKYGLMADITAMYRQILVNQDDRKVQNIIWRENLCDDLKMYELKTVTYGTSCAPYLATRCLVQLAHDNAQINPVASNIVKNDFYVDDLITGGSDLDEIQKIKHDVSKIVEQGCFQLKKWYSNHQIFLDSLPETEREKCIEVNNANVVKTLGVIWDATTDCFKFNYKPSKIHASTTTKRTVLSELSRLYDPLGLIKPVIVKAKIFLQELWLKQLSWDDGVPSDCAIAWNKYVDQLIDLNSIEVPRYVMEVASLMELHGFADASTRAYGACFYVRCMDINNKIKVTLLASRSKVAPINTLRSLPCLELCAAHLLVQLLGKVRDIANFTNIFLWSDSVIVLSWIAEHASNFNTFVANRVAYVQEQSENITWKYVPSAANPADILSRGATVNELKNSIWFTGPCFLKKPLELWPQFPKRMTAANLPECKTQKTVLVATRNDLMEVIYKKSDFMGKCRLIGRIERFIKNCRSDSHRAQTHSKHLSANDIENAFMTIVVLLQKMYYNNEIKSLASNKPVPHNSKMKELNPFVESYGTGLLLRVGGRLCNAEIPYAAKCPIILPNNDAIVRSYVKHLHITKLHAGAQALVCAIREKFWIIGARNYARKVVNECVHCFKYRPKMLEQIMGNLPKDRVVQSKPFFKCGVDFCGPITTTYRVRGKPLYKTYIAVFVCFVTRAVHMEVVSALTSDAFIAALKRFVGRRGLCHSLYCDNATNFVGARNTLKELKTAFIDQQFQGKLTNWCASENINFRHIPPRSPHFGGIWEAAVKSAKHLLYRTMQSIVLSFEELSTVVTQIEGILNSRPLTALTSDPSDETALTPAHFLNTANVECIIEAKVPAQPWTILKHWQQVTAVQQHFWARWSKEYITTLQQRRKWKNDIPNIDIGTLVIIQEEHLPPQKWLLGRIIKLITGDDGKIRVADIKTQAGVLRRAIAKLAALPIDDTIETS